MPRYTVQLSSLRRRWRIVTVEVPEADPEAARRRALAIARGAVEPTGSEDEGGWCDDEPIGRTKVHKIKPV